MVRAFAFVEGRSDAILSKQPAQKRSFKVFDAFGNEHDERDAGTGCCSSVIAARLAGRQRTNAYTLADSSMRAPKVAKAILSS